MLMGKWAQMAFVVSGETRRKMAYGRQSRITQWELEGGEFVFSLSRRLFGN